MTSRHSRIRWFCTLVTGLATTCGCAPTMITSFEEAQRLAAQQGRALFIFYESWQSVECGQMKRLVQQAGVRERLNDMVVCDLDEIWEPNQRFVAQYGVERYPAVIIIHEDGTYHQQSGMLNEAQLVAFVDQAKPPGRQPVLNPQIPRRIDYRWEGDLVRALDQARSAGRVVFVFYKSVISPDCNEMLFNVFNRPDVAVHFDDTVNCLLDWGHAPNRKLMARYGVTNVPAVVLIAPDGRYLARQGRLTTAQLLSFIRQAKAPPAAAPQG